ncbi:MAG TPA: hypothetical protein VIF09_10955, partial [Polyangiaceae bacterium]
MRRGLPLLLLCAACGGGAAESTGGARTPKEGDPDFAAYAATHGIQTLEGGGAAVEVTADGLRFEGLDKERPI